VKRVIFLGRDLCLAVSLALENVPVRILVLLASQLDLHSSSIRACSCGAYLESDGRQIRFCPRLENPDLSFSSRSSVRRDR